MTMAGGGQNLGHATFNVTANTQPFVQGMKQAQAQAQTTASSIGRSMLQIGYAVDDMQYGFRAIANNIPQIAMGVAQSFGASTASAMAFAGALGIVATGINLLINHWDQIVDRFQAAWSGTTVEQLETIRRKAEEAAAAFDKIGRPKAERAEAAKVGGVFAEADKDELAHRLGQAIGASPMREEHTNREKAALKEADLMMQNGGPKGKAGAAARIKEISDRINEANRKKAEELIGQAAIAGPQGDNARLTIRRLAPDLAGDIENATPEGQKRQADFEKQVKARSEVEKRIKADQARKQQELERRLDGEARLVRERDATDEHKRKLMAKNAENMAEEDVHFDQFNKRKAKEEEHDRTKARHLRRQVRDLMKPPEREKSAFFGFADFAKHTQTGILNNHNKVQEQQLEVQRKILELIEDNPDMRTVIQQAVAAGPP